MPLHVLTAPPAQSVDLSPIRKQIDDLIADDATDDKTLAALKSVDTDLKLADATMAASLSAVSATVAALDAKVNNLPRSGGSGEITPVFDPLPTPAPLQVITSPGAVLSATTGSLLVNGGKTHNLTRTTTPPLIANETTFSISPVVGECRLRWSLLNARVGDMSLTLGGAAPITASNAGLGGWTCNDPSVRIVADGAYSVFDVLIPIQPSPLAVKLVLPTGGAVAQLPCLYSPSAPFSLVPAEPTGLKLRAATGDELIYRPAEFAKKAEVPLAVDLSLYPLKSDLQFTKVADPAWFNTGFDPRYARKVSKSKITSLALEYKQQDGTIQSFTLSDFVTSFTNSGFWNGSVDPNGVTRFVAGPEVVVVSWDGTGENLTLAVPKGAGFLQIRKVRVNGLPLDWLPVYYPA